LHPKFTLEVGAIFASKLLELLGQGDQKNATLETELALNEWLFRVTLYVLFNLDKI